MQLLCGTQILSLFVFRLQSGLLFVVLIPLYNDRPYCPSPPGRCGGGGLSAKTKDRPDPLFNSVGHKVARFTARKRLLNGGLFCCAAEQFGVGEGPFNIRKDDTTIQGMWMSTTEVQQKESVSLNSLKENLRACHSSGLTFLR